MTFKKSLLSLAISLGLASTAVFAEEATPDLDDNKDGINHVLLISVDGLHQSDLEWYVKNYPHSSLASLVKHGVSYNAAATPFPSDSFPGMVGQVTGGNPKTTGVYYDDEYSRSLVAAYSLDPANSTCTAGAKNTIGAEVYYAEVNEPLINGNISLDAGQNIPNLYPTTAPLLVDTLVPGDVSSVPATILKLASSPNDVRNILIDPTTLPKNPVTCAPIYPHQYLKVNTVFEVAKAHGLHTAWTDKHPTYEILNGPSGYGIDDLFAPEINSVIDPITNNGLDWTKDNTWTQKYDTIKVASIINEINGKDHSGVNSAPVPAIFGLNFQVVSTAQKLYKSTTPENSSLQFGGYKADGTPDSVIVSALNFVDGSVKQFQDAIKSNPVTHNHTAIILSAKHGQSPVNRADLTMISDNDLINNANAAWAAQSSDTLPLIAHAMDDDGVLWWLNNRTPAALTFAKNFLNGYTTGNTEFGITVPSGAGWSATSTTTPKAFTNAGLATIYTGADAAHLIGVNPADDRYPDVIGITQTGAVYAGHAKISKIAEHGGANINDRHVPIVVSAPNVEQGKTVTSKVSTVQIAPTILKLLNIDTQELQAVKHEKTKVLPDLN